MAAAAEGSAGSPQLALRPVSVIVAATPSGGIGKDNALPWTLPADLAYFRAVTTRVQRAGAQNAVIMGRRTWASIPPQHRPLRGRLNVVLSRGEEGAVRAAEGIPPEALCARSLADALRALAPEAALGAGVETAFVIGGAAAFAECLAGGASGLVCDTIYLTRVLADVPCDVFMPALDDALYALDEMQPRQEHGGVPFQFTVYRSRARHGLARCLAPFPGAGRGGAAPEHEELQYLRAIRDVIASGVVRGDRTGTGTISKFGHTSRWSLRNNALPLLTTKRVFWRGVAEELLWFISGCTNGKALADKGINIWSGNGSREYLDKCGLGHREVGDLGPVYGFQWRHFGAEYKDMHADYACVLLACFAHSTHTKKKRSKPFAPHPL